MAELKKRMAALEAKTSAKTKSMGKAKSKA